MRLKNFMFPEFETWNKSRVYSQKIGDYTCFIGKSLGGIGAAIANSDNSMNVYMAQIFRNYIDPDVPEEELRSWYEEVTVEINRKWKEYMLHEYFYDLS